MGAEITYEEHFNPAIIREAFKQRFDMDIQVNYSTNIESIFMHFNEAGNINSFASFRMTEYPGNCGIVVSHDARVAERYRNRGIGQYLHGLRIEIAQNADYTLIQCTTIAKNAAQVHILKKNHWSVVHTFINKRTGNACYIWQKWVI